MDEPMDTTDESHRLPGGLRNMERREFLTKAAAAGAIAWAAPVILSRPAYAQGTGSPACQPTITVTCGDPHDCTPLIPLVGPLMPSITITVGNCVCDDGTPAPTACVNFVDVPDGVVVYGTPGTSCLTPLFNETLEEGEWVCLDGQSQQVFFGPPRNFLGIIPPFVDATFTVTLIVWADCDDATNCHTFDIEVTGWDPDGGGCDVQDSATDLCPDASPCTSCEGDDD